MKSLVVSLLFAGAYAFPWVADQPGVSSPWSAAYRAGRVKRQQSGTGPGSAAQCPSNPNRKPAAAFNSKYPYNNAKNGLQGNQKGGYLVPAKGDTAHAFQKPTSLDIRGPCPGLNTAANHNFISRSGITTFDELVDAQQNLYNVGYDLATLLAALGLTLTDGDLVTERLSIGCDATKETSYDPALTGSEPGLDGHNKFEADTSLSRDDFFLGGGNDFSFNGTLFGMMYQTTGGNFDLNGLALYRYQRYMQSKAENPDFFFGPLSLLLFGAASFLYELMPSAAPGDTSPDLYNVGSFFGAVKQSDGTFTFNNEERIPDNWYARVEPYTNNDVTQQILEMYLLHPVVFGGNVGGTFVPLPNFGSIQNGKISSSISASATSCLLYQLATGPIPGYANSVLTPTVKALAFVASKLSPSFKNLGCPVPLT